MRFLRAISYANPDKKLLAGVAHIWQELLYEDGCTALIVLASLGRTVEAMRTALLNAVGEIERPLQAMRIAPSAEPISQQEAASAQQSAKVTAQSAENKPEEAPLEAYARDLTQAASKHELEPLIGRETELEAMIQILGKKMKNNPLLLGEPGVGKSALQKDWLCVLPAAMCPRLCLAHKYMRWILALLCRRNEVPRRI